MVTSRVTQTIPSPSRATLHHSTTTAASSLLVVSLSTGSHLDNRPSPPHKLPQ
ncbi:unnamed protein product [Ixodes pacificus]